MSCENEFYGQKSEQQPTEKDENCDDNGDDLEEGDFHLLTEKSGANRKRAFY